MISLTELLLLFVAAIGAGAVNALAGGGSIFTFPVLIAVGVPALTANITNTVALCPGYVGGVIGQWRDLAGQRRRILALLPIAAIGGLIGGLLLVRTSDRAFETLVPALVLAACGLLALQDRVRALLQRRRGRLPIAAAVALVLIAAVYGGYFGAGLSVIFLAALGIAINDTLTRLNALKQAMSLATNVAAALLFAGVGHVLWGAAAVMAVGALIGGAVGGRLASVVQPSTLRRIVIAGGVVLAIVFGFRYWAG